MWSMFQLVELKNARFYNCWSHRCCFAGHLQKQNLVPKGILCNAHLSKGNNRWDRTDIFSFANPKGLKL